VEQERGLVDSKGCLLAHGTVGAKLTMECSMCGKVGHGTKESGGFTRPLATPNTPEYCCMKRALYTQPDFLDDVNKEPRVCTFLNGKQQHYIGNPKFHCEFNPIEMYWGASKRELRKENTGMYVHCICTLSVSVYVVLRFSSICV
jgi:hypothetical protein